MKANLSRSIVILLVVLLSFSTLTIFSVKAQPRTITVPDDYPTIQEAIEVATDGDTIYVKEGNYHGPQKQTLVIDKSISIIGENPKNTILTLHPDWDYSHFPSYPEMYTYYTSIKINAKDVKISGLTILTKKVQSSSDILVSGGKIVTIGNKTQITNNILASGLEILGGSKHTITNNAIDYLQFTSGSYSSISNNNLSTTLRIMRSAISNEISGNLLTGKDTGILVRGSDNVVSNNILTGCDRGISIFGELDESSNNVFLFNKIYNNTLGIDMMAKGNNNVFFANYIAYNKCGVAVRRDYPPADSVFYNNTFLDNDVQVNTDSTYLVPTGEEVLAYHSGFFDNGTVGNYWSDYAGVDTNGDGIGDSPYVIDDNRTDHYPLMSPYTTTEITMPSFPSPALEPEPFVLPSIFEIAIIVIVGVVGVGLLVNLVKKRRK